MKLEQWGQWHALPLLGMEAALLLGLFSHPSPFWMLAFIAALALIALWGSWQALARARMIADTPTSRVASAAQGYAELRGCGQALGGTPLLSPVTGLPVLWYHIETYEPDAENKWQRVSVQESDASFLLDDGSGCCAIDPEGARMLIRRRETTQRPFQRFVEHYLIQHDPIYVIGHFQTLGSVTPEFDRRAEIGRILADWKRDRNALLKRFDLNEDGEISAEEWALVRVEAAREADRQRQALASVPEAHVMRRPEDGRLYLISDMDPMRLVQRMRLEAAIHALSFLATLAFAARFAGILFR